LGVVLERAGDWAVVKLADFKDTGVRIGSVLTSVNGELVMFDSYQQTIERLTNWQPPLRLDFRKAPSKSGYLKKMSETKKGTWKQTYFILDEGKLRFKNSDDPSEAVKREFPLLGAAVSLANYKDTGKRYCFRFLSGSTCLILRANNVAEMRDWAATLYHAIAIANGGRHVLAYERERIEAEEARQRAMEHQKVEQENAYIVDQICLALKTESIDDLTSALELAGSVSLTGELIDYAIVFLNKLVEKKSLLEDNDAFTGVTESSSASEGAGSTAVDSETAIDSSALGKIEEEVEEEDTAEVEDEPLQDAGAGSKVAEVIWDGITRHVKKCSKDGEGCHYFNTKPIMFTTNLFRIRC
jgi:PH domain